MNLFSLLSPTYATANVIYIEGRLANQFDYDNHWWGLIYLQGIADQSYTEQTALPLDYWLYDTDSNPAAGSMGSFLILGPSPTQTPLPSALLLFATGLGVMGLFGWRRKRKNAAAIVAAD